MILHDPQFTPNAATLSLLNAATLAELTNSRSPISARERVVISERIAMEAKMALLEPLRSLHDVRDANMIRRNQPGYDILVGERLRLQVKGGTYIESLGWTHKQKSEGVYLNYDILIFVDAGVTLNSDVGRLAKHRIRMRPYVDFYIVPQNIVRKWVDNPLHANARGFISTSTNDRSRLAAEKNLGNLDNLQPIATDSIF